MSGKSCTSGSVRSGAGSVRLPTATGHEIVLDALYERKRDNKSVRVLTVIVYVFCVSLAAIMLSLYYVFFWEPKDAQYAQRKVLHTVEKQTTTTTPMPTCFMPYTGGSDSTVNPLENATDTSGAVNITSTEESTFDSSPSATTPFDVESTTSADYTDDPIAANDTDSIT